MKKRAPIESIMTKNLYRVNLTDSLHKAKTMLENHHIRHLPVVSGTKLIGIISLTDIMRISFGSNFDTAEKKVDTAIFDMLNIEQVMRAHPDTVNPMDTIKEVAEILAHKEYHALPVIDKDENLVGIVTTTDMINYLLSLY